MVFLVSSVADNAFSSPTWNTKAFTQGRRGICARSISVPWAPSTSLTPSFFFPFSSTSVCSCRSCSSWLLPYFFPSPLFLYIHIYICSFQPLFGFPARIFSLFVAVPDPSFYRLSCTSLTLSVSFPLRSFWSFCHRGLPCLTSFSSIATRRFLFPTKVYMDLYDLIESQRYCPVTLLTVREERCVRIHYQTDTSTAPSLPLRPSGMEPGSGSWAFEGWVLVGCRIGWEWLGGGGTYGETEGEKRSVHGDDRRQSCRRKTKPAAAS